MRQNLGNLSEDKASLTDKMNAKNTQVKKNKKPKIPANYLIIIAPILIL